MEEAFLSYLKSDSALATFVGNRIFWGLRPRSEPALPALILTRISGRRDMSFAGASGLVESLVQADAYGVHYGAAKQVVRAVRDAVNGYRGSHLGVHFQNIMISGERDHVDQAHDRSARFRVSLDLILWHDE